LLICFADHVLTSPKAAAGSGRSVPLPTFSGRVQDNLRDGNVTSVWRELINESAHYYLSRCPNIAEKSEYRSVGERMWQAYPCIAHDGLERWVSDGCTL